MSLIVSEHLPRWYALYTRPRHEKRVDRQLKQKGIESYLPLRKELRQWSDRKRWVEEPLFRCYVFVRIPLQDYILALQTHGVVRMVSFNGRPAPIPDEQIEAVRRILEEIRTVEPVSYLVIGQRVEVIKGPLAGIRGVLIQKRNQNRLVIAIDSIRQAISIEINADEVKPVES